MNPSPPSFTEHPGITRHRRSFTAPGITAPVITAPVIMVLDIIMVGGGVGEGGGDDRVRGNINPLCGAGNKLSGIDLVAVIEDFRGRDRKGSGGRT